MFTCAAASASEQTGVNAAKKSPTESQFRTAAITYRRSHIEFLCLKCILNSVANNVIHRFLQKYTQAQRQLIFCEKGRAQSSQQLYDAYVAVITVLNPLVLILTPRRSSSPSLARSTTGRNGGEQASNMPKIASQSSEAPRDTEGGCLFANMFAEILSDPGVQKNMDVLRNRQPGKDGLSYSANSANVGGNADAGHKAP